MKIDSIQLDGFGCLELVSFDLAAGLNIFFGPNEVGKSTLQQAILALLYGFYQKNRRNAPEDELLERFRPWRGDAFGGRITVRADDNKRYRLVRSFDGELRTDLYDEGTGRELTNEYEAGRLGRLDFAPKHFGMSQEVFINTCFVRQADLHHLENVAQAISETIINLTDTGTRDRSASRAQDLLAKALREDIGGETARTKPLPTAKRRLNELEHEAAAVKQLHARLENDYLRRQEVKTELARLEQAHARLNYVSARRTRDELETKINAVIKLRERLAHTQSELEALTFVAEFPLHTRDAVNRLAQQWRTLNDNATQSDARADAARVERGALETKAAPGREQIRALEYARAVPIARENELRELEKQWQEMQRAHSLAQEKLDELERAMFAKQQRLAVSDADQQLLETGSDQLRNLGVKWQTARTRIDEAHTRANAARAAWRGQETLDASITSAASADTARELFEQAHARLEYLLARQKYAALQNTLDDIQQFFEREAETQKKLDAFAFAANVPLETRDDMLRLEQKWRTQREGWQKLETNAASARAEINALETKATPRRAHARAHAHARAAPLERADEIRALQERANEHARACQDAQTQLNIVMDALAAKNHLRTAIETHQELLQTLPETFVTRRTQWRDAWARLAQAQERADAAQNAWRALEMEDAQFEPLQERLTGVDAALLAELKTPPLPPPAPKPSARPIIMLVAISVVLGLAGLLFLIFGFVTGTGISLFGVALLIAALAVLLGMFLYRARRTPIAPPPSPLDARLTTRGFERVAEMDAAFAKWQTARPLRQELHASERALQEAHAELRPLERELVTLYNLEDASGLSEQILLAQELQVQTWRQESSALDALDQTRAQHEQTLRAAKQNLDAATSQWRVALAACGFTGTDLAQETGAFFKRLEERRQLELLDAQLRGMDIEIETKRAKESAAQEARTELQRVEGELKALFVPAGVMEQEIERALETYHQRVQAAAQYHQVDAARAELERERKTRLQNGTPAQLEAERDTHAAVCAQLGARYPAFANLAPTDTAPALDTKRAALAQARPLLERWQDAENARTNSRAQLGAVEAQLVTLLALADANALTDEKIAAAENQVNEWTRARTDLRALEELLPQHRDAKARAWAEQKGIEDLMRAILQAANLETVDLAKGVADFFTGCENQRELFRVEERLRVIEREIEAQRAREVDAAHAHQALDETDAELRELFTRAEISDAGMTDALAEYERRVNLAERQHALAKECTAIERERDALLQNGTLTQLDAQRDARAAECAGLLERYPEFAGLVETDTSHALDGARAENQKAILQMSNELAGINERLQNAFAQQRPLAEIEEEMAGTREKMERLTAHEQALQMAIGHLAAAADEHHRNFLPRLNHIVGSSLKRVTGGRYQEVHIDHADLQVRVEIPALHRPVTPDKLSRGAQEQIYLLLRLGLTELLSNGRERLPLILDDPLVNYDRARLQHALDFLAELAGQAQILLFTKDEAIVEWFLGKHFEGDAHRLQWMNPKDAENFQDTLAPRVPESNVDPESSATPAPTPSNVFEPVNAGAETPSAQILSRQSDIDVRASTDAADFVPHGSLLSPQAVDVRTQQTPNLIVRPPQRHDEPAPIPAPNPKPRARKPELVCWERQAVWYVGIEMAEEMFEVEFFDAQQMDALLERDAYDARRWVLNDLSSAIRVTQGDSETQTIHLEQPLLFKLTGDAQRVGRRVRAASAGRYLAIAPEAWAREEILSGASFRRAEPTTLDGYTAHFFDLEKGHAGGIAFLDGKGQPKFGKTSAPRFELVGTRLNDGDVEKGPLFGGEAPRLKRLAHAPWDEVKTIVVGREGRGRERENHERAVELDQDAQVLLDEQNTNHADWFFARVYDTENDLIDSLDFRFSAGLQNIAMEPRTPMPARVGHAAAQLLFQHAAGFVIEPAEDAAKKLAVVRDAQATLVEIPPDPQFDVTRWRIGSGEYTLEIPVHVERVWWAVGEANAESLEWRSEALSLARSDFRPTSNQLLWIRLPMARWAKHARVGFGYSLREMETRVDECIARKALRDFFDATDQFALGAHELKLEIETHTAKYETRVGVVRVAAQCKQCDFRAAMQGEMLEHVRAEHLDAYFRPLTYAELERLEPRLHQKIYKCLEENCLKYAALEPLANPSDAMNAHFKEAHRGKSVRYMIVQNVSEIRKHVFNDLLDADKCALCQQDLKRPTPESRWRHLMEKHSAQLYDRV